MQVGCVRSAGGPPPTHRGALPGGEGPCRGEDTAMAGHSDGGGPEHLQEGPPRWAALQGVHGCPLCPTDYGCDGEEEEGY